MVLTVQHWFRCWLPSNSKTSLIAKFMGPTWGPSGADRTQVGPMLVAWVLLSGIIKTKVDTDLYRHILSLGYNDLRGYIPTFSEKLPVVGLFTIMFVYWLRHLLVFWGNKSRDTARCHLQDTDQESDNTRKTPITHHRVCTFISNHISIFIQWPRLRISGLI